VKKIINTGSTAGPYSPAIVVTGSTMIFISGQIANDLDGDIITQANQILKKIEILLEDAGGFMSDVVKTTIYLKNIDDFSKVNEEYAKFFPSDPPTRATLQAAALPLGASLMIEALAIRT
jgi:2-iminobutanoate/2-iminopropanoate deaminase